MCITPLAIAVSYIRLGKMYDETIYSKVKMKISMPIQLLKQQFT